jgi:hypothetical protein
MKKRGIKKGTRLITQSEMALFNLAAHLSVHGHKLVAKFLSELVHTGEWREMNKNSRPGSKLYLDARWRPFKGVLRKPI